jgi:excisionase family DNA binding protein
MSQTYYTVAEVAEEFSVTEGAVRDWITKRKLMAIQPGGTGCAYRIPEAALKVFRDRSAYVRRPAGAARVGRGIDLYADRIAPVLKATGMTADDLLRRMATDRDLVARHPSFATDYAAFVRTEARAAAPVARAVNA